MRREEKRKSLWQTLSDEDSFTSFLHPWHGNHLFELWIVRRNIIYTQHQAWPELYSPCSVNKIRPGCIQTSFNATRHAGDIFVKYFLDDLSMKRIFQKFLMHVVWYESYQYSLGSRLDATFCINSVLIQSGSCFTMNPELWRCCISAGGFSFLCDIRHSSLKISRNTEVWNTCSSLHLTGSMSCW